MKVTQTWYPFFFERLLRIADSMQCTLYVSTSVWVVSQTIHNETVPSALH